MRRDARAQNIAIGRPCDRVHTALRASDQGTRTCPSVRRTIEDGGVNVFRASIRSASRAGYARLSPVRWRV
eukprot:2187889-Prymnesium_polylepis.1